MSRLFLRKLKVDRHLLFGKLLTITDLKNRKVFSKFILVGILNTLVGYLLFALLIYLGVFYLLSLTVSHILAVIHSFLWNKYFTFKSKNEVKGEIIKFALVYTSIYLVNFLLLYIWTGILKVSPFISQFFILFVITTISFFGQRYWVFKKSY